MKISIITATYNSTTTLRDTIQSVLNQTYKDVEYIVVDGLSTDNTIDVLKEYEAAFEGRMHWVSETDKGLYDAINKGIRSATGEIVGLLNSDDFFTSNDVLEQVVSTMGQNECDAVYGDVHFVADAKLNKCVRYYSSSLFRPWVMRLGLMPAHPSFYIYKDIYLKLGLYATDFKIAADFELLLRYIFIRQIKTIYIPLDFVTMREGGVSTSGINSQITIVKEQLKALRENNVYSNIIFIGLRYIFKVLELFYYKIKY